MACGKSGPHSERSLVLWTPQMVQLEEQMARLTSQHRLKEAQHLATRRALEEELAALRQEAQQRYTTAPARRPLLACGYFEQGSAAIQYEFAAEPSARSQGQLHLLWHCVSGTACTGMILDCRRIEQVADRQRSVEERVPLLAQQIAEARAAVRELDITDRAELRAAQQTTPDQRTLR
eukprot:scaffold3761_cov372-Prasinococcus_capsulatus_cf.AAC.21